MAITVQSAFDEFNEKIVNLDPDRTKKGRSSRDWLIGQLLTLPNKVADFPNLYDGMHIKYGSFARNTKIRPLDDIDLMLTFRADGATYNMESYGKRYILSAPETATKLRRVCNDDGTMNSIKLVNKLVSALHDIEHYKLAEKHRRQEAATLNLSSYEWNFDIVPAFYTDTGYYIIPDGNGAWKASDPRIDQTRVTEANTKHMGRVLQLIRLLKYWNKKAKMITMPSYMFENVVLNFVESKHELSQYIDKNLIAFWSYLETAIYSNVQDPKGFQGNLNTLTFEEKVLISDKAATCYEQGRLAWGYEIDEKNQEKSITKWRQIFGEDFPTYG
ncbi:MAG: nucleotidyltransferase [Chitinophagaceae bacterium]|nr:MAG: nucleotidyltransferase [Chitinophagaceae bacterium]